MVAKLHFHKYTAFIKFPHQFNIYNENFVTRKVRRSVYFVSPNFHQKLITMATEIVLRDNPYVNVHDKTVDILYRKKACSLPVNAIRKMYLSKRKLGSWASIPGAALFLPDNSYKLHIRTDDNEITFTVKSFERQHFLGLISWIRNLNKN
jgi:hypothetical protein